MWIRDSGRTLSGTSLPTALVTLSALGVSAVGLNCSAGPAEMSAVLRSAAPYAAVPLIAKPNAGCLLYTSLYKDIYIDPEGAYATPVFGSQMEEVCGAPSGYRPHLLTIIADKLGKNLGNQAFEPEQPEGRFHLLYRNITLDHIVYLSLIHI